MIVVTESENAMLQGMKYWTTCIYCVNALNILDQQMKLPIEPDGAQATNLVIYIARTT